MEDNKVTLNIPTFEILFGFGIIAIIIGILAPLQKIEFFGITIWFAPKLSIILIPLGIGLICGYITKKILPNRKGAYWLGLILGIIGLIISICIRASSNVNKLSNNNSKYDNIQRLAELKRNGVLTEQEYESQKSKILKEE